MGRVRGVVVAGVLAVAVSAVAAGPAVAAKGGNSDNAHACQQGGHQNRFEAETGNPFKNAGDCVSHGAKGGATSSLQFLTVPLYNCSGGESGTCWGVISGSGLTPGADWFVFAPRSRQPPPRYDQRGRERAADRTEFPVRGRGKAWDLSFSRHLRQAARRSSPTSSPPAEQPVGPRRATPG